MTITFFKPYRFNRKLKQQYIYFNIIIHIIQTNRTYLDEVLCLVLAFYKEFKDNTYLDIKTVLKEELDKEGLVTDNPFHTIPENGLEFIDYKVNNLFPVYETDKKDYNLDENELTERSEKISLT